MLTIKLAKVGKKNKKVFRIVISEKARDPYGKALEILGFYNPYSKELKVKADRVKYWISKGSTMTDSINNLFIENKIIEGKKSKNSKPGTPNKRKAEKAEKTKQKTEIEKAEKKEVKKFPETSKEETPIETPVKSPTETSTENLVNKEKDAENTTKESPSETPVK